MHVSNNYSDSISYAADDELVPAAMETGHDENVLVQSPDAEIERQQEMGQEPDLSFRQELDRPPSQKELEELEKLKKLQLILCTATDAEIERQQEMGQEEPGGWPLSLLQELREISHRLGEDNRMAVQEIRRRNERLDRRRGNRAEKGE